MQFIDNSYFIGEINIKNAWSDSQIIQAIDQYEKEILISLLGYKLYSLLIADCSTGEPVTQKYIDLVNGVEFIHIYHGEEITLKWEGLRNTSKTSLIAYYVFYKQLERDVTRLYGSGVSFAPKGEGWERVSPVNKLCATWERMRELYGKLPPEYRNAFNRPIKGSSLPGVFNCEPSAFNFLFANKEDYPDWIFTPQWNINAFGI